MAVLRTYVHFISSFCFHRFILLWGSIFYLLSRTCVLNGGIYSLKERVRGVKFTMHFASATRKLQKIKMEGESRSVWLQPEEKNESERLTMHFIFIVDSIVLFVISCGFVRCFVNKKLHIFKNIWQLTTILYIFLCPLVSIFYMYLVKLMN